MSSTVLFWRIHSLQNDAKSSNIKFNVNFLWAGFPDMSITYMECIQERWSKKHARITHTSMGTPGWNQRNPENASCILKVVPNREWCSQKKDSEHRWLSVVTFSAKQCFPCRFWRLYMAFQEHSWLLPCIDRAWYSLPGGGGLLHINLRRRTQSIFKTVASKTSGRKKMVFGYQIVQKINFGLRHIVSVSHLVLFFVCSPPCPILLWGSCRASQYKMDGLNSGWTLFNHKSWNWMHSKLDA